MALDVALKTKVNAVFFKKSAATRTIRKKTKGADIFLGALVTIFGEGSNKPKVDLAAVDEPIFGVVSGRADDADSLDNDADSPFGAAINVMVTHPVPGDVFYVCAPTNTAVTFGSELEVSAGFAIDSAGDGLTPPTSIVGIALQAVAATAATEKYFQAMKV